MLEMESQPASVQPAPQHLEKVVLVCLGKRKWEVAFIDDGEGLNTLLDAIRETFSDVFGDEQLLLQVKNEEWSGEFVDVTGDVPDKSVLKVILLSDCLTKSGTLHIAGHSRVREVSEFVFNLEK